MLRVGGCHLCAVLFEHREDDRASSDEGLLVGEGNRTAQLDGLDSREETSDAHHSCDDCIGTGRHRDRRLTFRARDNLRDWRTERLDSRDELFLLFGCCEADDLWAELGNLEGRETNSISHTQNLSCVP